MHNWWVYVFLFLLSCSQPSDDEVKQVKLPVSNTVTLPFNVPELPDEILFCGERLLLTDFESEERLHREFITNAYFHSATIQILLRTKRYFPVIDSLLKVNGIPEDMRYLCVAESGLSNVRSPAGALGFWQFMPETAKEYGLIVNDGIDERMHLIKSTNAACAFLKESYAEFGDWSLTAASYNMGKQGVRDAIEQQGVDDFSDLYLNSETSRYVMRIIALKYILEDPAAYGFKINENDYYLPVRYRSVTLDRSIPDLRLWAKENKLNYKLLKVLNPWILGTTIQLQKGNAVTIQLPVE
jgi:hypothetical protein